MLKNSRQKRSDGRLRKQKKLKKKDSERKQKKPSNRKKKHSVSRKKPAMKINSKKNERRLKQIMIRR